MADTMPMEKDTSKPKKVKQKSADSGISREEYMKKEAAKAKAAKDEQRAKAEEEREKEKAFKIAELKRKAAGETKVGDLTDDDGPMLVGKVVAKALGISNPDGKM